ncbi:MAG: DUF3363 domain-containing protein [Pseudomonadota bacterium]
MTKEDAFTPRLGKIRDRGAAGGARLRKRVTTTAKQLSRSGKRSSFTGKRLGRGGASAMQANYAARRYASMRQRRVIIKTHISKPGKIVGAGVFSKHLKYLQRDGVERDGSDGELYTREGREVDADAFTARSQKDRHQFRFIVSPEDADKISDLKKYTRELMEIMERDLGTRLDWVAVDHHNTGRSHTHIVVRGKDNTGKDLIIAPDYIGRGMRDRASVLATEWLGPRRDLEILKQQNREVEQDRFTGIDRQLDDLQKNGEITIEPASTTQDRFKRDLQIRRLKYLEDLKLAEPRSQSVWRMQPDWQDALKSMSKRGDIIKAIAAGLEPGQAPEGVRFIDERPTNAAPLIGIVHRHGPSDELRDTRFLLVRDFEGDIWHAEAGALKDGPLPPRGAIVELKRSAAEPRQSDRTIASIAEQSGGVYSDELHARRDPSSSAAYRLAHKRRLEALRRAGIVERQRDGGWKVDEDYLSRVQKHEAARGRVSITTRSWLKLDQQVTAKGETWLDRINSESASHPKLKTAKQDRLKHLRKSQLLDAYQTKLTKRTRAQMNAAELQSARARLAKESGRKPVTLGEGETFEGVYERSIYLGQGRFAIISKSKEFALAPWRKQMEAYRGRNMVIEARSNGVAWQLPGRRNRGISR